MKLINKRNVIIATVITVVAVTGVAYMSKNEPAKKTESSEVKKEDRLIEIKRTETVDPVTQNKTVTEEPIFDLPPQKAQPKREEVVTEPEVDIKTYARRVLTHRWSAEVVNENQWICFDTFMQSANGWNVTEAEVDSIIDKTMKYSNPCAIMRFYQNTGTY